LGLSRDLVVLDGLENPLPLLARLSLLFAEGCVMPALFVGLLRPACLGLGFGLGLLGLLLPRCFFVLLFLLGKLYGPLG
jgi:hypothetical protein